MGMIELLRKHIPEVTVDPVVRVLRRTNQGPNNSTEECSWRKELPLLKSLRKRVKQSATVWETLGHNK